MILKMISKFDPRRSSARRSPHTAIFERAVIVKKGALERFLLQQKDILINQYSVCGICACFDLTEVLQDRVQPRTSIIIMKFIVASSVVAVAALTTSCQAFMPATGVDKPVVGNVMRKMTIMAASNGQSTRGEAVQSLFRSLALAGMSTALVNGASSPANAKEKVEYLQEPTPVSI